MEPKRKRIKARQWLRRQTIRGKNLKFAVKPELGGVVGSLVGLGFIKRDDAVYTLTRRGSRWIGAEPHANGPT